MIHKLSKSPKTLARPRSLDGDAWHEADAGPLAVVRTSWNALPAAEAGKLEGARTECAKLRDLTLKLRKPLKPVVPKVDVSGISNGSQAFILWRNRFSASRHRTYSGDPGADL